MAFTAVAHAFELTFDSLHRAKGRKIQDCHATSAHPPDHARHAAAVASHRQPDNPASAGAGQPVDAAWSSELIPA